MTLKAKIMLVKLTSSVVFLVTTFFAQSAYSIPTKWEDIKISMGELINSGYTITAHGSNRISPQSNVNGRSIDIQTITFLLVKDGKYVYCSLENPKPPIADIAGCRKIN
jgi:hypothetical protein